MLFAVVCHHCRETVCEVDRVRAADEAQLRKHLALHREDVHALPLGEVLHHFEFARA